MQKVCATDWQISDGLMILKKEVNTGLDVLCCGEEP